jgi:hypothetical protein
VWAALGQATTRDRWLARLPALSDDLATDLTGEANDQARVGSILNARRSDLQGLRDDGAVGTGLTRLSIWKPTTCQERPTLTRDHDFALIRGVPCCHAPIAIESPEQARDALDHALALIVPDAADLPFGPLFLQGAPLVIQIIRPGSLIPLANS